MTYEKNDVVVLGCGAAGYPAAKTLARGKGVSVTVVDSNNYFEFKPALYSILKGKKRESIGFNLRKKLRKKGIEFVNEDVTRIDPANQQIETSDTTLAYDYLLVALGGEVIDFGIDPEEVTYLTNATKAAEIREQSKACNEIAILGGGATGTETAFTLESITENASIRIIEAGDRLASQLSVESSKILQNALRDRNISIHTAEPVEDVTAGTVTTSEDTYSADLIIQATGVRPAKPVRDAFGKNGLSVDTHLQSIEYENIFGAGDAVTFVNSPTIRRAYHATKQSSIVAANMLRTIHNVPELFEYQCQKAPIILTLGGWQGLFEYNNYQFTGVIPHLMEKIGVDTRYILQYKYLT